MSSMVDRCFVPGALVWEVSQTIYFYTERYSMQLLFVVIVGTMTIFRHQRNRRYRQHYGRYEDTAAALDDAMVAEGEENDRSNRNTTSGSVNDGQGHDNLHLLQHQDTALTNASSSSTSSTATITTTTTSSSSSSSSSRSTITRKSVPPPPLLLPSEIEEFAVMPGVFPLRSLSWKESWTEECHAVQRTARGISDMAYQTLRKGASFLLPATRPKGNGSTEVLKHPDEMPPDVQVNILSFLHPKDIVTFAGTSKACRDIVDGGGPTTVSLWKTLWDRDYGWIIHSWEVGRQAYQRSIRHNVNHFDADDLDPIFRKEFYFRFGLSYVNYILAGLNTQDKCMVGLHGNIYDMTDFVLKHPGSPDTLLVHAGRDSTQFFDDMDHSRYARRVAKNFCVTVDTAYQFNGSYGLRPTAAFQADRSDLLPTLVEPEFVIGKRIRKPRRRNCLEKVYIDFHSEQRQHRKDFKAKMKTNSDVLHSNIFYDPFRGVWTGWYTTTEFKTVFAT